MVQNLFNEKKILSTEFKQFFLLKFTEQLIRNSAPIEVLKLREILKDKGDKVLEAQETIKEEIKEHVREVLKTEELYEKSNMPKEDKFEKKWTKPKIERKSFPFESFKNVRLTIPETNLPERLRYLKPTPVHTDIDLGQLNPLIKDPYVKTIECQGPSTNIVVIGTMGEKKTKIVLDEQDIKDVITKFSLASKIPIHEGVYKVAVGKLIFMAIVSEVVSSKFIIKKMIF